MPVKYWALFYVFKGIGGQNMMNEYRERADYHCTRKHQIQLRRWVECPECVNPGIPTKEPKEFRL